MLRVERLGDPRDPLPLRTELEDAAHDPCLLLVNRAVPLSFKGRMRSIGLPQHRVIHCQPRDNSGVQSSAIMSTFLALGFTLDQGMHDSRFAAAGCGSCFRPTHIKGLVALCSVRCGIPGVMRVWQSLGPRHFHRGKAGR
jgi:hypothetical protein